jgi:hypothetical protein
MKKIMPIVCFLAFVSLIGAGCQKSAPVGSEEAVKQEAEQALSEAMATAKNIKGKFDLGQVKNWKNQNEEFTVSFQAREYGVYPEIKRTGTSQASYKITGEATKEKIGIWEPKVGEEFLVVYFEVKGDAANFGQPSSLDQTGSDPSPQFYLVDKSGKKYSLQTAEAGSEAFSMKIKSLMTISANTTEWTKSDVVFTVPKGVKEPTLLLQVKTGDKQYEYYGVKMY